MNQRLAKLLQEQAQELATKFSDPNRNQNAKEETFSVVGIKPLSDHVATITYSKNTGKLSLAIAIYIKGYDKEEDENNHPWYIFFPTDSHLLGLCGIKELKLLIEKNNYSLNFKV